MLFPYSLPYNLPCDLLCNLSCSPPCSPLKKASTNYRHDILSVNSQVIDQCMMTVQDRTVMDGFHRVIAERSFTVWLSICARAVSCHSIFVLSYRFYNNMFAVCISITVRSRFDSILMISLRLIVMSRMVLRRHLHPILHLFIYQLFQVEPATVLSVRSRVIFQVIVISFSFLYFISFSLFSII